MLLPRAVCLLVALGALPSYCEPETWLRPPQRLDHASRPVAPVVNAGEPGPGPIRIEALESGGPPMFVLRGGPHGSGKLVFIHGMCGHALGYAQSFQSSAAKYGVLVAPQGDVSCGIGSPWSKWSLDTAALDARIAAAFRTLGYPEPLVDVTAIGYSQGASRAEALARRWPERYTRLILIAGPTKVSPYGLRVGSTLMMAGSLDRQDLMQASARAFRAAGRRAHYMQLPEARHGSMGANPERSMADALAWLYESELQVSTD